jgi:hypothetical protein
MKLYNDINENILMKHLQEAYYETLEKNYSEKNYKTYREYPIMPGVRADFVTINNDNEMIIYEIKIGKLSKEKKERLYSIKEYVEKNNKNVKFKMVFLNFPKSKEIEFDELQDMIFSDIFNKDTPQELAIFSHHANIEGISNIEIDYLEIIDKIIHLQGNGIIEMSFHAGSDRDAQEDDFFISSFPLEFEVTLKNDFTIEKSNYKIDTDSFFE